MEDRGVQLTRRLAEATCEIAVPAELRDLFERRGVKPPRPDDRRRFVRHATTGRALLDIERAIGDATGTGHPVFTLDISRNGIGLLHHAQLFPGDLVTVHTPVAALPGVVQRCRRHSDKCWQIGIRISRSTP